MSTTSIRRANTPLTQQRKRENITNLIGPNQIKTDYVKATLYFLDGSTHNIVNVIPRLADWGEPLEEAAMMLKEYVFRLCKQWIKITHFEIEFGSIDEQGSLIRCGKYCPYEIPLNKVFVRGTAGQWLAPADDLQWAYLDGELIP